MTTPDTATPMINEDVAIVLHDIVRENDSPEIARSLRIYEATMHAYAPSVRMMQSLTQSLNSPTIVATASRVNPR